MDPERFDDAVSPPAAGDEYVESASPPVADDTPSDERVASPRQQQVDSDQYQQALSELNEWRQYGQDRQSYDAQQYDWQAQQHEAREAQQVQARLAAADQEMDRRLALAQHKAAERMEYDPKGALTDMAAAAAEHQRYYRTQRTNIITTLEQRRQAEADRFAVPEVARYYAGQHGLDDQSAQVLMNLPPQQIPAMAQVLGMSRAELKKTQDQLQAMERTQRQQTLRQNPAHTPPGASTGRPANEPDVTSDAFLREHVLGPLGLR